MSPRFLLAVALVLAVLLSPAQAQTGLVSKTYSVVDLVVPFNPGQKSPASPASQEFADRLNDLVSNTVAPHSWHKMGGPGTIDYFPLTMAYVINQTPEVHRQVEDLFQALRRLMDQQVVVEARFLSVDEAFFERVGRGLNFDKPLTKGELYLLLEAVQGDARTNVMQAPKITVFDGQKADVDVTDRQTFVTGLDVRVVDGNLVGIPNQETFPIGTRLSVRPVICGEDRSVEMKVEAEVTQIDGPTTLAPITLPVQPMDGPESKPVPLTQYVQVPKISTLKVDRSVSVPNGGTTVINLGKRTKEGRHEFGPPVLSKIPYISRLFKNVGIGKETEQVLLLVTAHVMTVPEVEEKKPVAAAPCPKADAEEQEFPRPLFLRPKDEPRIPVLPPINGMPPAGEPPSDAEVLKAMPRGARGLPQVYEEYRDDIRIVKECIVDRLEPAQFYPLIGRAQMHKCHWKCTIYFTETMESGHPFPVRATNPRVEVVYIDKDCLHLCPEGHMERIGIDFGGEEQEPPAAKKKPATAKKVAELVKKYRQACAEGNKAEAKELAEEALALDPTCFAKPAPAKKR